MNLLPFSFYFLLEPVAVDKDYKPGICITLILIVYIISTYAGEQALSICTMTICLYSLKWKDSIFAARARNPKTWAVISIAFIRCPLYL